MSELCTLNPDLLDHINAVTNKAADPPPPAQDKVPYSLQETKKWRSLFSALTDLKIFLKINVCISKLLPSKL